MASPTDFSDRPYSNRPNSAHEADPTREEPLTATEARQASRGRPVLIVLLVGLVIALLAWIPAEWWGASQAPDKDHATEQANPQNAVQPDEPKAGN